MSQYYAEKEDCHAPSESTTNSEVPSHGQSELFYIIKKTWMWILTLFITYAVTLSAFPGLAVLIESVNYGKVNSTGHISN